MPPIATTGVDDRCAYLLQPVDPDRRVGIGLRRCRPDRSDADVVAASPSASCASETFAAESPSSRPWSSHRGRTLVGAPEMDAVGAEHERGLDVVVDDERHAVAGAEAPRRTSALHNLDARHVLQAPLHDRRARLRPRAAQSRGPRRSRAASCDPARARRASRGSSPASASYRPTWNEPGPFATPRRVFSGDAEGGQRLGRRLERLVALGGQEAAGDRARHAARTSHGRQQLVPVRDGEAPRSPSETWSIGPVTEATRPRLRPAARARSAGSLVCADRLDAPHLRLDADERRDLTLVAAQHGDVHLARGSSARCRCGTSSRRRRRDRARRECRLRWPPCPPASIASTHVGRKRADVEHERARQPDHLLDLLACVRHHGQRAECERRVRRLVHDDVVRDLVDEGLALAQHAQALFRERRSRGPFRSRTSTGPSPARISTRPCATAAEAACGRGACGLLERPGPARDRRRASPNACNRRRAWRRRRGARRESRRAARRRRGDRPLRRRVRPSRERPPLRARGCAPRDRARGRPTRKRLRLAQVRRHDGRERKQARYERLDRVVLQQLRTRARDHHRIDDKRDVSAPQAKSATVVDQRAREEHPGLRGVDADVVEDQRRAAPWTKSGGTSCTAVTPTVFCAVSATIALMPWQPAAAKAFRSAWIPAPPPESEPAIVRHLGINSLPSPVLTGSGSTGVISARAGTPVGEGYRSSRRMGDVQELRRSCLDRVVTSSAAVARFIATPCGAPDEATPRDDASPCRSRRRGTIATCRP